MDSSICLGLVFVLVPIVLIVVGVVEIQKLKKTVREFGSRIGALESRDRGVVAPSAPVQAPTTCIRVTGGLPAAEPNHTARRPAAGSAAAGRSRTCAAQGSPQRAAAVTALAARETAAPPPVPQVAKPIDWEAFFGVKLFAWIGGFVLFLGIVFLVKYSFENNLITPAMRVVIGTVVGLALIVTGWLTATRRYRVSGQSLCATGVLVLYGNIFAAHVFYHLIALVPAFASMAIVTAAAFFLAVRMNAQVIVVLGLLGGFLTPVLLSTGVDNPIALFGYIAVLNVGIAAVALRKRWDYLVLLAAAGTALTRVRLGLKFFEYPKANIAFVVFLGFEAQFLAIFAAQRRTNPTANWAAGAVIVLGFAALAAAFCFPRLSDARSPARFPFHVRLSCGGGPPCARFSFEREPSALLAPASGLAVFVFLATWTGIYLNDALLWWGLGGYVVFALLHAGFAFWPGADAAVSTESGVAKLRAVAAARAHLPVRRRKAKHRRPSGFAFSFSISSRSPWRSCAVLSRRSSSALVVTIFAAALWILTAPTDLDLRGFLIVAAGSGAFFFSAALFAARKFFPDSENVRRNIPALAASMPFLLLLMAIAKLPIVNPTPFFITAFFLAVLLLGLGVVTRTSWIALSRARFHLGRRTRMAGPPLHG